MCLGAAALPFPLPLLPLPQPCRTHAVPGTGCHQAMPREAAGGAQPPARPPSRAKCSPCHRAARSPCWGADPGSWLARVGGLGRHGDALCASPLTRGFPPLAPDHDSARPRVPSPAHAVRVFSSGLSQLPPWSTGPMVQDKRRRVHGADAIWQSCPTPEVPP